MVRVVVGTEPLPMSVLAVCGLFVELFAGKHVGVHVEHGLSGVDSGVEDQTEGAMELLAGDFCATSAMWASCAGSSLASSATFA